MVSDFRKKKLLYVFSFYDTDNSGNISKEDFDAAVKELARMRGWKAGEANYTEAEATLLKVWEGIKKAGDSDGDGQVSADEWIKMWDAYASDKGFEWQNLYSKFFFSIYDTSNDGALNLNEYIAVSTSFGVSEAEAKETFEKLTKGSTLTWAQFEALWKEYFQTEDPAAPGNFIFGKLP